MFICRGQMGVYVEPAEKAKKQKIPNGPEAEKSKKKHKGEKKFKSRMEMLPEVVVRVLMGFRAAVRR